MERWPQLTPDAIDAADPELIAVMIAKLQAEQDLAAKHHPKES